MTPGRLAAAGLAAFLALAPTIGLGTSYADGATPTPTPTPSRGPNDDAPAQIVVTKLAPRAPMDPAEFFQVRGLIVNRGSQPLHDLTVRLRRGEKLSSRSELATADQELPATPVQVGPTPVRALQQDLAPGQTTQFDIRIRVSQLLMTGPRAGVYPLRVEARGIFGGSGDVDTVGSVNTYVPWFPEGPPHGRIRIAWLWPLVDQPRRGPREIMLDDELATSFARGGRLDRLMRSAASGQQGGRCDDRADGPPTLPPRPRVTPCRADPVPVTYAVDPDLLFTADALGSPYQLLDGAKTRRIENTAPARDWVAGLRNAVGASTSDVLSLPYGDPDAVALTSPQNGLADEVPLLRELGRKVTTKVLRAPMTSVIWPPTGRLTRRSVESLTSGGATALVVDPVALPEPDSEPNRTPDALVGQLPTNTGTPSVLTIDPELSTLLTPSYADYPGDRIVEQRWLVETAMISAEAPSLARTILVAPGRRADLHTAVAADAIRDSGRLPWMCAVSVTSLADASASCPGEVRPAPTDVPPVELEPPHPGDTFLSPSFLTQVRAARNTSTQFTDEVLAEPTSPEAVGTTGRLLRARARTESSAWREHPSDGENMVKLLDSDLQDLRGKVHLQVGSGVVTLTSSSGVISVNVVNELQQPVRIGVVLNAHNRARLSTQETPVTLVPAEHATQINLKVTAQTSGQFPVTAQLVDREGRRFGAPVDLIVRSTQYGRVALAVTGIAAGVLLFAAGFRIVRRATRRG